MDKPIRILVATPVAGGVITHDYMHGISAFLGRCAQLGWSTAHLTQPDALVTRSRNSFASVVVRDKTITHLLMLDADVVVPPTGLERLVLSGHDLVGTCVPLRNFNWDKAKEMSSGLPTLAVEQIRLLATEYAVWFAGDTAIPVEGFITVNAIGSGAMLISRTVLERIAESDLVQYASGGMAAADGRDDGWTFFDPFVDERGNYLSEDYALCRRWAALGGQVWADIQTTSRHVGPVIVPGDIAGTLAATALLTDTDDQSATS